MHFTKTSALLALGGAFLSASALPIHRRQTITDFGSCGTPEVTFALGLDGRRDPAFQAVDQVSFPHGSALGIGVITSFICQQLNDKCKAPQATLTACATGQSNAAAVSGGKSADAFNAAFGIITPFATTGPVQGNSGQSNAGAGNGNNNGGNGNGGAAAPAPEPAGAGNGNNNNNNGNGGAAAPAAEPAVNAECPEPVTVTVTQAPAAVETAPDCPDPVTVTVTVPPSPTETVAAEPPADNGGNNNDGGNNNAGGDDNNNAGGTTLDLGSCTNPTIEFGPAFDGRKASENSFQPADRTEFSQGSALNGAIVANAICNILKDRCQAPAATIAACEAGKTAFNAAPAGGAKADAFNKELGFATNFATILAAPGGGPGSAALTAQVSFGTCTDPTIAFGPGFDGRAENSFQPANKGSFNHGSALNGNIITEFICNTLVNSCNANTNALNACAEAKAATAGLSGQAFADAFNARITQDV